ncbi:hypothetical protein ACLBKU_08405 [Erythrobacter sp. NE805]|uniref:hypothetical protein n=1 Tax=Erythrobacter sp. NE805 TaxID=3389875 RepID=UPI00396AF5DA
MTRATRLLAPALLAAVLTACTIIPDAPMPESLPAPPASPVALGQAVQVGAVVATPMEVVEDSRCPANARCIWAGRLVVRTRIDGAGWRETGDLALGEPFAVRGVTLALTSGNPAPTTDAKPAPSEYRFTFEAR